MADADFQAKLARALTWAGIEHNVRCIGGSAGSPCHHPFGEFTTQHWYYELTDELAMRLLRECAAKGLLMHLTHCPDYKPDTPWEVSWDLGKCVFSTDPARAIVLAVAALAEQEEQG